MAAIQLRFRPCRSDLLLRWSQIHAARVLLIAIFFLKAVQVSSQASNHRLLVLNEGRYDYRSQRQIAPVSISLVQGNQTSRMAALVEGARFASDMILDEQAVYVAADSQVIKLDRQTLTVQQKTTVPGCRKLCVWKNCLLVSIGKQDSMATNLLMLDKNDLHLLYAYPDTKGKVYSADKMIVDGDRLFLVVNNAFDSSNRQALVDVIDLSKKRIINRIEIPGATNTENLMWDDGDRLFTVNNHDYTKSSVSTIHLKEARVVTKYIVLNNACATSGLVREDGRLFIYFQEAGKTDLGRFDVEKQQLCEAIPLRRQVYSICFDKESGDIYLGVTDYVKYGSVYRYTKNWIEKDLFGVGISPGTIVIDTFKQY